MSSKRKTDEVIGSLTITMTGNEVRCRVKIDDHCRPNIEMLVQCRNALSEYVEAMQNCHRAADAVKQLESQIESINRHDDHTLQTLHAYQEGRSGVGFVLLSLVLSPLIRIIVALIVSEDREVVEKKKLSFGDVKKVSFLRRDNKTRCESMQILRERSA